MEVPKVYRSGTKTAILIEVRRTKLKYIPLSNGELVVKTADIEGFLGEYTPIEYSVQIAATKYLEFAKSHGISDCALGILEDVAAKGRITKEENIEMATEKKVPQPIAKAAPAKAAPAKAAPAKAAPAKAAPAKAAPAKAAPAGAAPAKAAPAGAEKKLGRTGSFSPTMKIVVNVETNPKRGTAAERFDLYKTHKTIGAYIEAGGTMADIRWDVKQDFISVQ